MTLWNEQVLLLVVALPGAVAVGIALVGLLTSVLGLPALPAAFWRGVGVATAALDFGLALLGPLRRFDPEQLGLQLVARVGWRDLEGLHWLLGLDGIGLCFLLVTTALVPLALLATLCYAGAAIYGRGFKGLDPMIPAAGSLVSGAALLVPVSLVVDRPWTLAPSAPSVLALLALAVFSTALALVLYFRLVQTLGSVGVTAQAYLRVPFGVAIGVVFLDESLAPTAWLGLLCVMAGVVAMTRPARHQQSPRPRT